MTPKKIYRILTLLLMEVWPTDARTDMNWPIRSFSEGHPATPPGECVLPTTQSHGRPPDHNQKSAEMHNIFSRFILSQLPTGSSPPATLTRLTCSSSLWCGDGLALSSVPRGAWAFSHCSLTPSDRSRNKNSGQECRNAITMEDDSANPRVNLHWSLHSATELSLQPWATHLTSSSASAVICKRRTLGEINLRVFPALILQIPTAM